DVLGKTLISKTIHYNNTTIDLSALTTGMYLVTLKANGQTKTVKISKH
ncbi:T9SS type A sorting domain-containing protein, partial [Flavobacterium sp.]